MSAERIVVGAYDPRWPPLFAAERAALRAALGPRLATIEHGGSMAVPGLAAKPIIDLFGALRSLDEVPGCVAPLAGLGYVYAPEVEVVIPERRYFRQRSAGSSSGICRPQARTGRTLHARPQSRCGGGICAGYLGAGDGGALERLPKSQRLSH